MKPNYTAADFDRSPFLVFYEITRACDLACAHCRACAQARDPIDLPQRQQPGVADQPPAAKVRLDPPPSLA